MSPADVALALPSMGLGEVCQFGFPWHGQATNVGGIKLPNGEFAPVSFASSFPPFHRLVKLPGAVAKPVTPQYIADQGGEFWNCALLSSYYRDPGYTCLFGRPIGGQAIYESGDGSVWLYKVDVMREGYAVNDWYEFDPGGYAHDGEMVFSILRFGLMPSPGSEWVKVSLPSLRQLFGDAPETVEHVMGGNKKGRFFNVIVCDSTPAGDRLLLGLYSHSFFDGTYEVNGVKYTFAPGAIFGLFEVSVSGVPGTESFTVDCVTLKSWSDCTQGSYSETKVPAPSWSINTDYLMFDGSWSGMCNGELHAKHLMSARYDGADGVDALYKSITATSSITGQGTYTKLHSEDDRYYCTGFSYIYSYSSKIDICGQSYSLVSNYSEIGSGESDKRSIVIGCSQATGTPSGALTTAGQQTAVRGEDGNWSVSSSGERIPPMAFGSLSQDEASATYKLALATLMTPLIRIGNLYGPWGDEVSQRFYDVGVVIHSSGVVSHVFVQGGNRGDNYVEIGPTTTPGGASDSTYRAAGPDDVKSYSWCPVRDELAGHKKTEEQVSWV